MHCPDHCKGITAVSRGNNLATKTAKEVGLEETAASMLFTTLPELPNLQGYPVYTEEELGSGGAHL